jgi:hypothetical protein
MNMNSALYLRTEFAPGDREAVTVLTDEAEEPIRLLNDCDVGSVDRYASRLLSASWLTWGR